MKENKVKIPFNLQFFAEPATEPAPEPTPTPEPEPTPEPQLSAEEQLQQMRVEMAKMKKSLDKATGEAADYKKQLRAKQSEDEIRLQEKAEKEAERQEQFDKLLKENTVNKLSKNFLKLGYPEDKAEEAANAQYEGDTDTLYKLQREHEQSLIKQKEAEWLKSRPVVTTGAGDEKTTVTKEEFNKMGYSQRVEFKQKYPETYKSYTE